jgi:hypothetical protein
MDRLAFIAITGGSIIVAPLVSDAAANPFVYQTSPRN